MPTGKVRFFDADKGFGFIAKDGGGDVFVRSNVLPAGVTELRTGQRVEFGVMDSRRGEQALSLELLEAPPSLSKNLRKKPEQMAPIVEDLINFLDGIGKYYAETIEVSDADSFADGVRASLLVGDLAGEVNGGGGRCIQFGRCHHISSSSATRRRSCAVVEAVFSSGWRFLR